MCAASAEDAMAKLEALAAAGEDVALVLAAQWLDGTTGSDLLGEVRALHAHAQRGLLIEWRSWGDGRTGKAVSRAMARRQIDHYVIRPSRVSRRAVPPVGLHVSARVGVRTAGLPAHRPGRRRVVDRPGLRAEGDPGALRAPSRVPPRRLGPRQRAGRGDRGGASAGGVPERQRPREPEQPGAGDLHRCHDRSRAARVRRRHHRCRAGRPLGRGLRRVGGIPHAGRRRGRDRRTGDLELPDSQLPRFPARRQRASACRECMRAGVGLRGGVRVDAERDLAPARRRLSLRQPLEAAR